jgi:hypothetical protein
MMGFVYMKCNSNTMFNKKSLIKAGGGLWSSDLGNG